MAYDGYEALANALVAQAAEDYKFLLKAQAADPDNQAIVQQIRTLEREIHAPFFQSLTRLDIDWLFGKVRDEFLTE